MSSNPFPSRHFPKKFFPGRHFPVVGGVVAAIVAAPDGRSRKLYINTGYLFDLYKEDGAPESELEIDLGGAEVITSTPTTRPSVEEVLKKSTERIKLVEVAHSNLSFEDATEIVRSLLKVERTKSIERAKILVEDNEIILLLIAIDII